MNGCRSIKRIIGVVIVLCCIMSLCSVTAYADVEIDVKSYEKYDFYVKISSDNKTIDWQMEDKSFNDVKDYGIEYDHVAGKDMEFYPKMRDGSSSNLEASIGSIMYYDAGTQEGVGGTSKKLYVVLCYSTGEPIYVKEKGGKLVTLGEEKSLNGIQITLMGYYGNDISTLNESGQSLSLSTYEKWSNVPVYNISKSSYVEVGSGINSMNTDEIDKMVGNIVNNRTFGPQIWYEEGNLNSYTYKWSEFGYESGKCNIAFYKFPGKPLFLRAVGKKGGNDIFLCDKSKGNNKLITSPKKRDSVKLTDNYNPVLSKVIVAGVYAGESKLGTAAQLTDAWSFSNTLNTTDSFRYEIDNMSRKNISDIKLNVSDNELLKQLFTIKVPGSKFSKRGYWYLALDYVLGEAKDAVANTYTYASYRYDHTCRAVIGVKKTGEKDLVAVFSNRSTLRGNSYSINEKNVVVGLDFTGTPNFSCKIKVYDIKDINEDKIKNDSGTEEEVLKAGYKELYSAETNNIKLDKNNNPECDLENFKVKSGAYHIPMDKIKNIGTYYVEIAAKEVGQSKYIIKWFKLDIVESQVSKDGENGDTVTEESTKSEREAIEANRELTFAEERKIDALNKEIDNKMELERWSWVYIVMAICGIIILVYSVLLLLAYYFDLFNSVTEVSIYHKLTFGNMYPVGSINNIEHLRLDENSKVIYATHKTAWISFVIGVLASAILLNGRTVVIMFIRLVTWFSGLISNIGG